MTASTELTVAEQPQQLITIEPTKYVELVFEPFAKRLADAKTLAAAAEFDVTTTAGMAVAVKHRATFRDIRVASEKARKERKAPILEIGKLLDSRQKEIEAEIEPFESRFDAAIKAEESRKEAEKQAKAAAEAERVRKIKARIESFMLDAVTASDGTAVEIDAHATALSEAVISLDEYMEFAGEAQVKRNDTVKWLRERQQQAADREAEAKRLKAEREQLDRERAEAAERERVAAIARAEQEAKDRAERERVEAEQREAREQAAAAMRAEQAQHEARMRAQQAEIDRQQHEINRAKAEQERVAREAQERADAEAKAKREAEEAEAARIAQAEADRIFAEQVAADKARRDQQERERAECLAARYSPGPTGGTWSIGKTWGAIVSTAEIAGSPGSGHNDAEYYGGNLICESVWRPADAHVLAAAHDMFYLLKELIDIEGPQPGNAAWAKKVQAVLVKATYVPEVQPEAQAA